MMYFLLKTRHVHTHMCTNVFWISSLKRSRFKLSNISNHPLCQSVISKCHLSSKGTKNMAGSGSRAGNAYDVPGTRKLSKLLRECKRS